MVEQEQFFLGLPKLEADAFDEGATQADLAGGHAAEIPFGEACSLVQPFPRILDEQRMLWHSSPPKDNRQLRIV